MKVLVTGGAGFVGSRLVPKLGSLGFAATPFKGNLLDSQDLAAAFATPWDHIVHLAGQSHVPTCESDPAKAFQVNVAGTAALLHYIGKHSPQARVYFASTTQVYAPAADGVAIDETHPIQPQNTYARTKWDCELLLKDAHERQGLAATVFRIFNHSHKSQAPIFFVPYLFESLSKFPRGSSQELPVGNLDLARDIGIVDDLVDALAAAVQQAGKLPAYDVFNLCSGDAKNLREIAQGLAKRMEISVRFVTDPARVRPGEPKVILGSNQKFRQLTGWTPRHLGVESFLDAFMAG